MLWGKENDEKISDNKTENTENGNNDKGINKNSNEDESKDK